MASLHFVKVSKLMDLLTSADPTKASYIQVLSKTRLAVGADPLNPSVVIDLTTESIVPYTESKIEKGQDILLANPDVRDAITFRASRRGGEYWFEMKGRRTDSHSLKELLATALLAIEKAAPGTFEKLTHVKPRSRRIVARDPKDLFEKPHLAKDYAEKLADGWFYGTNNSANETSAWLQRACAHAGLKWGEDFKTSLMTSTDDFVL